MDAPPGARRTRAREFRIRSGISAALCGHRETERMTKGGASEFDLAFGLHAKGAFEEAEAGYLAILAQAPDHADARHHLGVLHFQRGKPEAGIALIVEALRDDPSAKRFNELGNIHAQLGELGMAADAFRDTIRLSGTDSTVWNNLGSVLQRAGETHGAEAAYRSALGIDPDFVPALLNLALLLGEAGRDDESTFYHARALIQPPFEGKPLRMLALAHCRLGNNEQAADCYRGWLEEEPGNPVALHHHAACGGGDIPVRAPDEYVTAMFDAMAEKFDEKLVDTLGYCGPAIVEELLLGQIAPEVKLDILDAGCGTGLCMPVLAPIARRLTGVDLSEQMLKRARARGGYDELVRQELSAFLSARARAYDLVVVIDTLIYFGEITPVLAALARTLRPGGMLAFTTEATPEAEQSGKGYVLTTSGRYAHGRAYLLDRLRGTGFHIRKTVDVVPRRELGRPVEGVAILACSAVD